MMLLFAFWAHLAMHGEVLPAPIFGDGAVLQRDMSVPIWGTATPGEKIEVVFCGQTVAATTDGAGRWRVVLEPLSASAKPSELIVRGRDSVIASNILVGDVWLCSGQSNMEMRVRDAANAKEEMAAATFPRIRQFYIPRAASETPQAEVRGSWTVCSPATVGDFSAAAYYFGRELHQQLNVPIGLINSSRGATQIESWMSEESLRADPAFARVFERWQERLELIPTRMRAYEEALVRWDNGARRAREQGLDYKQRKPKKPDATEIRWRPAGLYNAMIHPITPASIRGVIWYQGETNSVRHAEYVHLFTTMITQWRAAFRQSGLPFYYVQLANTVRKHDATKEEFAFLREAQRAALRLPGTGMVVTVDIGDNNIHPANKQEVGRRLAGIALAKTYGRQAEYSGPLFERAEKHGREFHIQFSHAQGLYCSAGRTKTGFEIADRSLNFVGADVRIDGDKIIASSTRINEPHAVRYAWGNTPVAPLFNRSHLPASPFLHIEGAGQGGGVSKCMPTAHSQGGIEHVIVYKEEGKFAGWPANGGFWSWGDELLVCFEIGSYKPRASNHAFDPAVPMRCGFARSVDGGATWTFEEHANVRVPVKMAKADYIAKPDGGFDFSKPGFAMKFRDAAMWATSDRGRSWQGPFWTSNQKDWVFLSRTSYSVTDADSAFVFMTARTRQKDKKERSRNRSQTWRTDDGGKTFNYVSSFGEADKFKDVGEKYDAYSIMPSALRLGEGHYVCAVRELIRREKWVRIYESKDFCRTWVALGDIAKGAHNPAALVSLGGLRIAAIYGSRQNGPQGIYGRISNDGGRTWEKEVALRQDAASWDFGYPVATVRKDGAIVAVYYMTTKENPQQHIAATIWKPGSGASLPTQMAGQGG